MQYKIENLTRKPIWITLNSQREINVATQFLSAAVDENEVEGNVKLSDLETRGVIRFVADSAASLAKSSEAPVSDKRKDTAVAKTSSKKNDATTIPKGK